MTVFRSLDGAAVVLDLIYRDYPKFDPTKFKVIAINGSDAIEENSTFMEFLKLELSQADGYSRKSWAPGGAPVKDLISKTVNFEPVIVSLLKSSTPLVTQPWDCLALVANASVQANIAIASISSNAFQATAHGLVAGERIFFDGAITYPGITADTYYWVSGTGLTANQFRVAATSGGTAIALTTFTGLLTGRCANGVLLNFEKVPTDAAGNNTRFFEPGSTVSAVVRQGLG